MTKIKTAQAWGFVLSGTPVIMDKYDGAEPVVIVHGLTDALAAARADALRWVLDKMEYQYPSLSLNIHQTNGIYKERNRLRAIIEKELAK